MQRRKTKNSNSKKKRPWFVLDLENNYSKEFDTKEEAHQHLKDIVSNIEAIARSGIRTAPAFHLVVTRYPKKHLKRFTPFAKKAWLIEELVRLWEISDLPVDPFYVENFGIIPMWKLNKISPLEEALREYGQ